MKVIKIGIQLAVQKHQHIITTGWDHEAIDDVTSGT